MQFAREVVKNNQFVLLLSRYFGRTAEDGRREVRVARLKTMYSDEDEM